MAKSRIDQLTARSVVNTDLLPPTPTGGPSGSATVAAVVKAGLSQPNSATSGAGADLTVKAPDGVTSGAGGSIILQPGVQATTGGDGVVSIEGTNASSVFLKMRGGTGNRYHNFKNASDASTLQLSRSDAGTNYIGFQINSVGSSITLGGTSVLRHEGNNVLGIQSGEGTSQIIKLNNRADNNAAIGGLVQFWTRTSQPDNAIEIMAPGGSSKVLEIRADGSIRPASIADSSAANNSIYFSTTANKLVFKDSSGTVNNLY